MSSRVLILKEKYARLLDSSGNSLQSSNGSLNVNLAEGSITSSVSNSTTTVWDSETITEGATSDVHNCSTHGKITVFGSTNGNCTFKLQYSSDELSWYNTHNVIMVGADGIIDGTFDTAVPYIRLIKEGADDVSGTVLVSGKGV